MGNLVPCGGNGGNRRSVSTRRCSGSGRLLTANLSGFSTRSSGDSKTGGESLLSSSSSPGGGGGGNGGLGSLWTQPECISYRNLRLRRPKIRAIVALPKHSPQYNAAKWALDRLGVESVLTFSTETAIQALNGGLSSTPHIVLLDSRRPRNIDAEALARHVRQGPFGEKVIVVGVVKKSFIEREEVLVASHLRAGFDRVLIDSGSRGYWMNELVLLLHNDVDTNIKLNCSETILTALESCQDIVQITDKQNRVIYENPTAQRILGFSPEDLASKSIWDFQSLTHHPLSSSPSNSLVHQPPSSEIPSDEEIDTIQQKLDAGKIWEGPLNCRRKSGDYLALDTKIIPISFSSRRNSDHVIYVRKPPVTLLPGSSSSANVVANMSSTNSIHMNSHIHNHNSSSSQNSQLAKQLPSSGPHAAKASSKHELPSVESPPPPPTSTNLVSGSYHTGRRQSGPVLPGLSIEAPITKIVNIILSVQEKCPATLVSELDRVIEILQATMGATDLFSPELSKDGIKKRPDPVAEDLLGALLSNSTRDALTQRRGSTEPVALSATKNTSIHRTSLPNFDNSPVATRHLLENSSTWDFNILELEKLTNKRCLVWLGMTVFLRFQIHKTLNCAESTLQNWLTLIEANYNADISYHNSTHAADVLHAVAYFLESPKVKEYCDGVDEAICLIAAVIHDVDHPGRNSAFLCNSGNPLANLYNDITVLENHHASLGFKLTQSDKRVNIFQNLDKDSYKLIRQGVIDLVLATDMSKHFFHVNKFASVFNTLEGGEVNEGGGINDGSDNSILNATAAPSTPENVAILKRMLIKCADVANPARPLHICKIWAFRIAEEYFSQTDDEKRLGLTVVMPQFDRATCSIPKSQIGFYDFFINDMFDCLNNFDDFQRLVDIIQSNYVYWKEEAEMEQEKESSKMESKVESKKEDLKEEDEEALT